MAVLLQLLLPPVVMGASTADREDWAPAQTDRAPDSDSVPAAAAEAEEWWKSRVVVHQMLAGREIAKAGGGTAAEKKTFEFAKKMKNFQYFVGDAVTGEVAVVDGAWDPAGLEQPSARLSFCCTPLSLQ